MIVSGVFVDPLEWFDGRWIEEHIQPEFALGMDDTEAGAAEE